MMREKKIDALKVDLQAAQYLLVDLKHIQTMMPTIAQSDHKGLTISLDALSQKSAALVRKNVVAALADVHEELEGELNFCIGKLGEAVAQNE